jgi:hypothetical protein
VAGVSENAYDIAAERSLLGLAMTYPDSCSEAILSVESGDWWHWRHQTLAAVICDMIRGGASVDPTTVLGQIMSRGLAGKIDGPFLLDCTAVAWAPQSAVEHAARIRELSGRRNLAVSAQRLSERLDAGWQNGDDTDVHSAVAEMRKACDDAEVVAADRDTPEPIRMDTFLAEPDSHDWLIPGLLERQERMVITGAEGGGKSYLTSQLATCMAGGVHPFTAQPLGKGDLGVRVLVIDCENSAAKSRRRFRRIVGSVDQARSRGEVDQARWGDQMHIDLRPAGIDLLSTRDVSWLEHAITSTAPDLLVLGPLYKLHHQNPSDETAARELVWVLDGLRERHGFALITEAHAGNAADQEGNRQMRPIGSSLFRRWPEYGFGLTRAKIDPGKARAEIVDVVSWRGSREDRQWPEQLQHSQTLPWMPTAEYWDQPSAWAA